MKINVLYTQEQKRTWWDDGEWINEPDEVEFEHAGYTCLIRRVAKRHGPDRVFGGHLCGYVILPSDHPLKESAYNEDFEVHGGITFNDDVSFISDTLTGWAIGFDCGHAWDIVPWMEKFCDTTQFFPRSELPEDMTQYRNIDFCISETKKLAEQLRDLDAKKDCKNE